MILEGFWYKKENFLKLHEYMYLQIKCQVSCIILKIFRQGAER